MQETIELQTSIITELLEWKEQAANKASKPIDRARIEALKKLVSRIPKRKKEVK
jgi:hypothetical protein